MSKLWDSNCENYLKPWINWFQLYLQTPIERYFSTRFIFAFRKLRKSRNVKNLKNFFGKKTLLKSDKSLGNRKPKLFFGKLEKCCHWKHQKQQKRLEKTVEFSRLSSQLLSTVSLLRLIGLLFENLQKRSVNKKRVYVSATVFISYSRSIFRLKWLIKCYPKT